MKKRSLLLFILPLLGLYACSTSSMTLRVMRPADIIVDRDIKTIVLLNRTKPQNSFANGVEGFLSGETPEQDRRAVEEVLNGLQYGIGQTDRYNLVRASEYMTGSGSGIAFPDPLSWHDAGALCSLYKADAVLAIETFDSDFRMENSTRQVQVKGKDGKMHSEPRFTSTANTRVTLGFRMYYPAQRSVYDQQQYGFTRRWSREGRTPAEALSALIAKMDAIMQTAYFAGEGYARKISPYYINVGRMYYRKAGSNPSMKAGARALQLQKWDDAGQQWQYAYDKGRNDKEKGRAAYNLALVEEINGRLPLAKDWADKAYMLHRCKKALRYSNILNARIIENERLNQQLGQ